MQLMIARKLLGPINLFVAQAFCIHKAMEVIVIYKDKNFIFATF